ncbi:EI24 domain-containing protein [Rhodovulum sulfidophilum]|uniref:EI24 domain-containing protein n=1 Tax=Rhodovulum sulfidophilum TaxID=35806 RepID=A0ABS1RRK7_RHOSU|nr:EI24 domain-containing protein [Rhodovulum sulfidophilum]MBL3596251.1 EI24 domain-containing protein [Rhodovulum sulfidophilum]MBL3608701.1 EI24 domain-containing protein [Rhodovulum sulfidophilum]MCE8457767.1 EI24 domain-containing protein [Rhodovulum sulfidophilum]
MILSAFLKTLGQIGDRAFRRVLLLGIGLSVLLLAAIYAVIFFLIGWLVPDTLTLPWIGEIHWVDNILSGASFLLMIVMSVFLMVPVASAFTGIFLDDVAEAVEARHYPDLPPATPIPLLDQIRDSIGFLGVVLGVNLVALVLYFFVGPVAPFLFWAVNGFLLGREYFQMAAMRRLGRQGARDLRRRHGATIFLAGLLMAVPLSLPLVNLVIPILGAAVFTHLVNRLIEARRAPA